MLQIILRTVLVGLALIVAVTIPCFGFVLCLRDARRVNKCLCVSAESFFGLSSIAHLGRAVCRAENHIFSSFCIGFTYGMPAAVLPVLLFRPDL